MDLDLVDWLARCAADAGHSRLTNQASSTSTSRPTSAALILAAGLIRMRFTGDRLAGTIAVAAPLPYARQTAAEQYRYRADHPIENGRGHSSQRQYHHHDDGDLRREG